MDSRVSEFAGSLGPPSCHNERFDVDFYVGNEGPTAMDGDRLRDWTASRKREPR